MALHTGVSPVKLLTLVALLPPKARVAVALAGELQRTGRDHETRTPSGTRFEAERPPAGYHVAVS